MRTPVWAWCALVGVIAALLAVDLYTGRHATQSLLRALVTSGAWIVAGIGFGAVLGVLSGPGVASQYFAGYALEKSLSIDNVFVFAMIFTGLGVPSFQQRRVLFYGVVGALVLRAGFIAGGAAALQRFGWVLGAFAVFLLVAGVRMARGGPHVGSGGSRAVRLLSRVLPVSAQADGERFWTRAGGRRAATPLFVALVAVEAADIALAVIAAAVGASVGASLAWPPAHPDTDVARTKVSETGA
ncbi:MAG TPA: hypothetical protein VFW24_15810 [Acidimicrobiales bacterium]|nr:hypothetical protein [Acidimicrobiales bacterium]